MKIVPPQLLPKLLGIRFDKITQNGMNELDIFKTLTLVRVIFWEFFFFFFCYFASKILGNFFIIIFGYLRTSKKYVLVKFYFSEVWTTLFRFLLF